MPRAARRRHPATQTLFLGKAWQHFIYFSVINLLLAHFPLTLPWKLWIGLFGFVLPYSLLLWATPEASPKEGFPSPKEEGKDPFSHWVLLTILSAGLFLRVYHPLTFISWPLFDETINAYYALQLDRAWTWKPFFFYSQLPPLYIWLLVLTFKLTGSFLVAIRVLPILLSILILALSYPAARLFFPRSITLPFLGFASLAFPFLFFGRLSHQGLLLLLVEALAFYCLGQTLRAPKEKRMLWTFLCGLSIGVGFTTYFSWILVASFLILLFFWNLRSMGRGYWVGLGIGALLPAAPLLWAVTQYGYGSYFALLWAFKPGWDPVGQLRMTLTCLSAFLWGGDPSGFFFGPVWGGLLDPLLGALFLLGGIELWKFRRSGMAQALLIGLSLFLLPAFLSSTPSNMREIQVYPHFLLASSFGFVKVLQGLKESWKKAFPIVLFSLIGLFSWHHLGEFSRSANGTWLPQRDQENRTAYGHLSRTAEERGPGLVLTSFSNDTYTYDASILTATYPFNASRNPRLDPARARWLSVITNIHFEPFLKKTFPASEWLPLSDGKGGDGKDLYNGGRVLGILPMAGNEETFRNWMAFDRMFSEMREKAMGLPMGKARKGILQALLGIGPSLPKDPFLRSIFWEMVYFNYSWENLYGDKDKAKNLPAALEALERAVEEGYPTAYFFNEMGTLRAIQGDKEGARRDFLRAVQAPLDRTLAKENLELLDHRPSRP